jgi:hypothetical protein
LICVCLFMAGFILGSMLMFVVCNH